MTKLVRPLLVGLTPKPKAHVKLAEIYKRSLLLLNKFPQDSAYRMNTQSIISFRLSVVTESSNDCREIEDNIGCGRIESLISQAEAEYSLLQRMLLWKPWEPLVQRPPTGQWTWPQIKT